MEKEIEIKTGEGFLETARELSDLISGLPLNTEDNDRLISAILKHTDAGRVEAYHQGFADAFNIDFLNMLESAQNSPELPFSSLKNVKPS